eukprot:304732-Heterocapsa_arctica.AAC.1
MQENQQAGGERKKRAGGGNEAIHEETDWVQRHGGRSYSGKSKQASSSRLDDLNGDWGPRRQPGHRNKREGEKKKTGDTI